MSWHQQLASGIAEHFGPRSKIRDIRLRPHSGYRAVHVWLRLPAGRAEVQVRTLLQSGWANVYERLGDRVGRGIRYGEKTGDTDVDELVALLHSASEAIAGIERAHQAVADAKSMDGGQAGTQVPTIDGPAGGPGIDSAVLRDQVEAGRTAYQRMLARAQSLLEGLEDDGVWEKEC